MSSQALKQGVTEVTKWPPVQSESDYSLGACPLPVPRVDKEKRVEESKTEDDTWYLAEECLTTDHAQHSLQ